MDIEISQRTIKEIHALVLHGIDRENAGSYRIRTRDDLG